MIIFDDLLRIVWESNPSCINSHRPGRVICSINAVGCLQLNVTCQPHPTVFPARKSNVYAFSKEFETDEALTCRVCFKNRLDKGCVFETMFEGIQLETRSRELKDHLGATSELKEHFQWNDSRDCFDSRPISCIYCLAWFLIFKWIIHDCSLRSNYHATTGYGAMPPHDMILSLYSHYRIRMTSMCTQTSDVTIALLLILHLIYFVIANVTWINI